MHARSGMIGLAASLMLASGVCACGGSDSAAPNGSTQTQPTSLDDCQAVGSSAGATIHLCFEPGGDEHGGFIVETGRHCASSRSPRRGQRRVRATQARSGTGPGQRSRPTGRQSSLNGRRSARSQSRSSPARAEGARDRLRERTTGRRAPSRSPLAGRRTAARSSSCRKDRPAGAA
jgi:hypothetical protein